MCFDFPIRLEGYTGGQGKTPEEIEWGLGLPEYRRTLH